MRAASPTNLLRASLTSLLGVAWLAGCAWLAPHAQSPIAASGVVSCAGPSPFKTKAARLVIATFRRDGNSDESVATTLEGAIRRFDEERDPQGDHRLFEVVRAVDALNSHDAARRCAENLGADAVLWGLAFDNPQAPAPPSVSTQVQIGSIKAGDHATISIGNIDIGAKPFALLPSITLKSKQREWLMTTSRIDVSSLADVDFEKVASDRSLFFVPFIAGAAAFERGDKVLAQSMFQLAADASLHATGTPRLYATTYVGALKLSLGKTSEALKYLAADGQTLKDSLPRLAWQNRMLLGLASEERGQLADARNSYAEAEGLESRVDKQFSGLATMAAAWTEIHMADGNAALASLNRLRGEFKGCADVGTWECAKSELLRLRILTLRTLAVGLSGSAKSAVSCSQQLMAEIRKLIARLSAEPRRARAQMDSQAVKNAMVSPSQPIDAMQIASLQGAGGCAAVHFPQTLKNFWPLLSQDPESVQDEDFRNIWRNIKEGRGSVGLMLKRLSPRSAHNQLINFACMYSLTALNAGRIADANDIAKDAVAMTNDGDDPVLRAETRLLPLRIAMPSAATREATIQSALPTLRGAMGASAPAVRFWEALLKSAKLPEAQPLAGAMCSRGD